MIVGKEGKEMEWPNLLFNSQQMTDLSLKAGQSRLVNAVLGDQKFIFKSQRQFCQVNISVKAEIQGLEIRTWHKFKTNHKLYLLKVENAKVV
jgi:hypothetical protein